LGVNGCQFGTESHHYFPIGKQTAIHTLTTSNIPDREILLAHSPFVADNFPNGKLSKP